MQPLRRQQPDTEHLTLCSNHRTQMPFLPTPPSRHRPKLQRVGFPTRFKKRSWEPKIYLSRTQSTFRNKTRLHLHLVILILLLSSLFNHIRPYLLLPLQSNSNTISPIGNLHQFAKKPRYRSPIRTTKHFNVSTCNSFSLPNCSFLNYSVNNTSKTPNSNN